MKTRGCLFVLGLTLLTLAVQSADVSPPADQALQYYEIRVYNTQSQTQQSLVNDYWQKAAIPACKRAGIQPIGVFTEMRDSATNKIYVLIPFDSIDALLRLETSLAADTTYQTAAADFMNRTKTNAPYARFDASLLRAMSGMPKLALPPSTAARNPWIFELRTYLSPTEAKGANKIDMFNAGEIQIMKEIGLNPVFFAGSILGLQMPNLVYMTSGPDMDQYKTTWKSFGSHPLWKKLSNDPQYSGNMSASQSVFLKRTSASEI